MVAETKLPQAIINQDVPQLVVEMHYYAMALALALSLSIWFVPLNDHPAIGGMSSAGLSQMETRGFLLSWSRTPMATEQSIGSLKQSISVADGLW